MAQREKRLVSREIPALAAFLMVVGTLLCFFPHEKTAAPVWAAERDGIRVTAGVPEWVGEERTFSRQTLLQGTLLLVSPAHPLPADYPAPSTRAVRAQVGAYLPVEPDTVLHAEAVYALCEMQGAHALEDGAVFFDGAVSRAQQEERLREAFERFALVGPLSEALARAAALVPHGGASEHQMGLAVDVRLTGPLELSHLEPLERNGTGRWISENMWRYGFILRYTRPGEEGACENVHLRYVGAVHAAAMHALQISLEEYWALLRARGGLTLEKDGRAWAYILCRPCAGDLTVSLPVRALCEVSADNTGWAAAVIMPEGDGRQHAQGEPLPKNSGSE